MITAEEIGRLETLDAGSTRIVLDYSPDYVVKVGLSGTSDNMCEIGTWEKAIREEWSHLLAALFTYSDKGEWLMMERCEAFDYYGTNLSELDRDKVNEVRKQCEAHGIFDLHLGNFGRTEDGRIVCIDYACVRGV